MSAGIEVLAKSIRFWWRENGVLVRETVQMPINNINIELARKKAEIIALELETDSFDIARHFPNSKHLERNKLNYYIQKWSKRTQRTVAPSSWHSYNSYLTNHIQPYFGDKRPEDISPIMFEDWLINNLGQLSNKTSKSIIAIWRDIWKYWQRINQKNDQDPSHGIKIKLTDPKEIKTIPQDDIAKIIHHRSHPHLDNFWTVLLWTGLSMHEQIALAIDDIDINDTTITVNRSHVRNVYKVTKNKYRKRVIPVRPIVIEALKKQIEKVKHQPYQTINVLDRDNKTYIQHQIKWLWFNPDTGSNFTYDAIKLRWTKHLHAAGVEYISPNQVRHTFATIMLSKGKMDLNDISLMLGHNSTQMASKHYAKLLTSEAKNRLLEAEKELNKI